MHGLAGSLHRLSEFGEPEGSGNAGCPLFKGNMWKWFCWALAGGFLSHPAAYGYRKCCSQPLVPARSPRARQRPWHSGPGAQLDKCLSLGMVKTSCGAQQTTGSSFLGSQVAEYWNEFKRTIYQPFTKLSVLGAVKLWSFLLLLGSSYLGRLGFGNLKGKWNRFLK